jgi:UV DNA damage repair endonuclease
MMVVSKVLQRVYQYLANPFKTWHEVRRCINDYPIYPCFHSLQFITATAAIESLRAQRRPEFARQLDECAQLLAETGALARAHGIRLTMHLPLHVVLAAPDPAIAARGAAEVIAHARLLDALQAGPEGVLVLHVGGAHGDSAAALQRFATRYERLPVAARRRVVVEPDEACFALTDLLRLHQLTGVPLVLDTLHHQLNNPERMPLGQALGLALATWPRGVRAKVHASTQRTEAHLLPEQRGQARRVLAPRHGQHADFINPFEFARQSTAARYRGVGYRLPKPPHYRSQCRERSVYPAYRLRSAARLGSYQRALHG